MIEVIIDEIYKKMEFCLDEVNTDKSLNIHEFTIYEVAYKTYIDLLSTIASKSENDKISSYIIQKRNELKRYCLEKGYK